MTVDDIITQLGLECLTKGNSQNVTMGYTSDLLSDVIANAEEGALWITVQRHLNIVAVAQLKKIAGIILTRSAEAEPGVLAKAGEEGIYVLRTPAKSYEISGRLYALLKPE